MKKQFVIVLIMMFLLSCSGGSEKKSDEVVEEEMVETISSNLDQSQKELSTETEESLNEIDSLLQNVE
ncbi:hypothetical protein [Ekhidna sp.]|uniref:hypothetical protein n=1 Tax=Ekhidna sp. TaxID=2608089 RepID=UPI0032999AE9